MNPRALLHPGIFERTGPLGWFVQGEWDLWGERDRTGPLGWFVPLGYRFPRGRRDLWGIGFPDRGRDLLEDGTSGVSFIKEAGNGFEGFLEE
jgi:hypothetical protein